MKKVWSLAGLVALVFGLAFALSTPVFSRQAQKHQAKAPQANGGKIPPAPRRTPAVHQGGAPAATGGHMAAPAANGGHMGEPAANGGHMPAPAANGGHMGEPAANGGHMPAATKHVENNQWMGHNDASDPRYHLDHPFAHGHFAHYGANYRYSVARIDAGAREFWLPGGFYFQVADWEWAECVDWCWTCADEIVVYLDPDSPGWYIVYNVDTGAYVHAQYMGE